MKFVFAGTHFCNFYETKQDLLAILVPFVKAGLENKEFCLWVTSKSLTEEEARSALTQAVPDLDRLLADRSIEILPHDEWYLKGGAFDIYEVLSGWKEKLGQALARGYAGMRVTGDTAWIEKRDWRDFREYEKELDVTVANQRMIVLCTFPLAASGAAELLDVAREHQLAVARRNGNWEVVESQQAKAEIERLNKELEQRVADRTRQLGAIIEKLRKEITGLVDATIDSPRPSPIHHFSLTGGRSGAQIEFAESYGQNPKGTIQDPQLLDITPRKPIPQVSLHRRYDHRRLESRIF